MTSFSQAVDLVMTELARPDLKTTIPTYLNQTLRELHFTPGQGAMPVAFGENRWEQEVIADTEEAYVWPIPHITRHQYLAAVWYADMGKYAKAADPSLLYIDDSLNAEYNFYRSGANYVFNGFGGIGSRIQLSWFEYVPRLTYYAPGARPATFDEATGLWSYLTAVTPEEKAAALELSTNWILQRWPDLCYAGTRAKTYSKTADDTRAKVAYSLYESQRPGFIAAESAEFVGFYQGGD